MNKLLTILLVIMAGIATYGVVSPKEEPPLLPVRTVHSCFLRTQISTEENPYSVNENIELSITDNDVRGTKSGFQSGPDMTNGYEGTLQGSIVGSEIQVEYRYTVEGSQNTELEIYQLMNDGTLRKLRWPLEEQEGKLKPTRQGEPTISVYIPEKCQ